MWGVPKIPSDLVPPGLGAMGREGAPQGVTVPAAAAAGN